MKRNSDSRVENKGLRSGKWEVVWEVRRYVGGILVFINTQRLIVATAIWTLKKFDPREDK